MRGSWHTKSFGAATTTSGGAANAEASAMEAAATGAPSPPPSCTSPLTHVTRCACAPKQVPLVGEPSLEPHARHARLPAPL